MTWQCELAVQKPKYIMGCTKKLWLVGQRGDSPPLLHPHETPPGVLDPHLGIPA